MYDHSLRTSAEVRGFMSVTSGGRMLVDVDGAKGRAVGPQIRLSGNVVGECALRRLTRPTQWVDGHAADTSLGMRPE